MRLFAFCFLAASATGLKPALAPSTIKTRSPAIAMQYGGYGQQQQQQQGGYGQQQQGGAGGLPFGWVQASDPASGQTYYYNEQTGQSSWEYPQQ